LMSAQLVPLAPLPTAEYPVAHAHMKLPIVSVPVASNAQSSKIPHSLTLVQLPPAPSV